MASVSSHFRSPLRRILENKEVAGADFRQFDLVTDYSDHEFAITSQNIKNPADCFTNVKCSVHKKIMKEWKILGESLPDSIYVRAYETRIDLLRAVIIGAKGTPYQDGLFFFDIAFPEDYPNSPPMVHYRSFGLRVNPNLYSCGTVCLSLLNTWSGIECENWNPKCSSILQILVSIQALVLNDKPYYNEPGLQLEPNYRAYNEKVFLLTCKTMHLTLRAPPCNFKDFVTSHFRLLGSCILKNIKTYKKDPALVGSFCISDGEKPLKISKSFTKDLDELYRMLNSDFSKIKAPGPDGLRPPPPDEPATNPAAGNRANPERKGDKKTILGYLCSKVKKVFKTGQGKSSSSSKMLSA